MDGIGNGFDMLSTHVAHQITHTEHPAALPVLGSALEILYVRDEAEKIKECNPPVTR